MPTLSDAALQLCAARYDSGRGCGRCPIHHACTSATIPLTEDTLDAWRARVNAAAEAATQPAASAATGDLLA